MPHEPLPPNKGSYFPWVDYKIETPTFSLTPVEKPDMSPYLIHMTGPAAIAKILKGDGASKKSEQGSGFLKAGIPAQSNGYFYAEVVCFTESPTFAIDFFRYRSFHRWQSNLLYGIGFSKNALVKKGALPAIYLPAQKTTALRKLYEALKAKNDSFPNESLEQDLRTFVESIYPFATPLGEEAQDQGFLWEREWRLSSPHGLTFSHADIRVICCPDDERTEIATILGAQAGKIKFVRTWAEFSDVTDYLERQQKIWAMGPAEIEKAQKVDDLNKLLQGKKIALHALESYRHSLEGATQRAVEAAKVEEQLKGDIEKIEVAIAKLAKK